MEFIPIEKVSFPKDYPYTIKRSNMVGKFNRKNILQVIKDLRSKYECETDMYTRTKYKKMLSLASFSYDTLLQIDQLLETKLTRELIECRKQAQQTLLHVCSVSCFSYYDYIP
jgi:hypothetical protein